MTNTVNIPLSRIVGAVVGLAVGDAVGYPTEFLPYARLKDGVEIPEVLKVSDDTQMALALDSSLSHWHEHGDHKLSTLRQEVMIDFLEWLDSQDDAENRRAPGVTCMSALRALKGVGLGHWVHGTGADSSGCGSVMRVPWVGLDAQLTDEQVEQVAMLQAVFTHAPAENAFCAAALARLTRALATDEVRPGGCAEWLLAWAEGYDRGYDREALGRVHAVVRERRGPVLNQTQEEYVADGLDHVRWVASTVSVGREVLADDFWGVDPCELAGQGWRARECMAVAVLILDSFCWYTSEDGVRRAAMTNGDSDSIGAITGALIGATRGIGGFPSDWFDRLEVRYQIGLSEVIRRLSYV